jgi:hypothetical protein
LLLSSVPSPNVEFTACTFTVSSGSRVPVLVSVITALGSDGETGDGVGVGPLELLPLLEDPLPLELLPEAPEPLFDEALFDDPDVLAPELEEPDLEVPLLDDPLWEEP